MQALVVKLPSCFEGSPLYYSGHTKKGRCDTGLFLLLAAAASELQIRIEEEPIESQVGRVATVKLGAILGSYGQT